MAFFSGWCQSVSRSNTSTCCGRFWEPRGLFQAANRSFVFEVVAVEDFDDISGGLLMEPILPVRWMDVIFRGTSRRWIEQVPVWAFGMESQDERGFACSRVSRALLSYTLGDGESSFFSLVTDLPKLGGDYPLTASLTSRQSLQKDIVPQCHQIWVNVNPGLINHGLLIRRVLLQ